MAIDEKIAAISERLQELSTQIKVAAASVREVASRALRSAKLDGYTLAQIRSQLSAPANAHIARRDNPHGVTAAQIDIPTRDHAVAEIDKLIPSGIFPISRYGNQTYLPVPASGGIEAVRFNDMPGRNCPGMVENDGSYIFLYAGADGGTQGVYYGYVDGVGQGDTTGLLSKTIRRYRPSFVPDGHYVSTVQRREGQLIMGLISDEATHASKYLFYAVCNDTMEDQFHTGCLIPYGGFFTFASSSQMWNYILLEDGIYMFRRMSELTLGSRASWRVFHIPHNQVESGEVITPVQLTGWNVEGFVETYENQDDVLLATAISSDNPAHNPYVLLAERSTYNLIHSARETMIAEKGRVVRLRLLGNRYSVGTDQVARSSITTFSFTIDLDNRTARVDDRYRGQVEYDLINDPTTKVPIHQSYWIPVGVTDYEPHGADNRCVVGAVTFQSTSISHTLYLRTSDRDYFDILEDRRHENDFASIVSRSNALTYPTPLGTRFMGGINLPDNRILVGTRGTNAAGNNHTYMAYCRYSGLPDKVIPSIWGNRNDIVFNGYAQTAERWFLSDRGLNQNDYIYPVTHVDDEGIRNYGTAFYHCRGTAAKLSAAHTFDKNLVRSGNRSISESVIRGALHALINQAQPTHQIDDDLAFVGLIIPQETNALPILVALWAHGGTSYWAVCNAQVVWTGDAVTSVTLDGAQWSGRYSTANRTLTTSHPETTGQNVFYDAGDTIMAGGVFPGIESHVGDSSRGTFRCRIDPVTGKIVPGTFDYVFTTPSYQQRDYLALPGYGFGFSMNVPTYSDDWSRYTFVPMGTTIAEFDAYRGMSAVQMDARANAVQREKNNIQILLTLRPASDFMVYFTEAAPLFLAGNYYLLPDIEVDLTTIHPEPGNKTFYVYAQLIAGRPRYTVTLSELADTETTMFIGTVVTDSNTVAELNLVKVDRIGPYRLSNVPAGSSIPTTSGHPSDPSRLDWW